MIFGAQPNRVRYGARRAVHNSGHLMTLSHMHSLSAREISHDTHMVCAAIVQAVESGEPRAS